MKSAYWIALMALVSACASARVGSGANAPRGKLIRPSFESADEEWSADEQQKESALRNLRRSPEASFHLLRVRSERERSVHERSDLVLVPVAGTLDLELEGEQLSVEAGDIVEIPRGTAYALHNRGAEAGVAYLVFTPALAADDIKRSSAPAARESAWKWNLWLQ